MKDAVKEKLRNIELGATLKANKVRDYVNQQVDATSETVVKTSVYKNYFEYSAAPRQDEPDRPRREEVLLSTQISQESFSSRNGSSPKLNLDMSLNTSASDDESHHTLSDSRHHRATITRIRRNSSSIFETNSTNPKNTPSSTAKTRSARKSRVSCGSLGVRVRCAQGLGAGKVYFVIEIEQERFISPLVFADESDTNTWEIGMTFEVCDMLRSDLRVLLYKSNYLMSDTYIGQVIVPVSSVAPLPPLLPFLDPSSSRYHSGKKEGWMQVFPIGASQKKFRSGMDKPKTPPGRVLVALDFSPAPWLLPKPAENQQESNLISRKALLKLYMSNMEADEAANTAEEGVAMHRNLVGDILVQVSDLSRHVSRIFRVKSRISAFVKDVVADVSCIRRFQNPALSVGVYAVLGYVCLKWEIREIDLDVWQLPLVLFLYVVYKSLRVMRAEQPPVKLWNDKDKVVTEEKEELSQTQKILKISFMIGYVEGTLSTVADSLERLINAFSWSDEYATFILLFFLLFLAILSSLALYLASLTPFTYLLIAHFLFPLELLLNLLKTLSNTQPPPTRARTTSGTLSGGAHNMSEGKFANPVHALRSVVRKVPSSEEMGHMRICELQFQDDE